ARAGFCVMRGPASPWTGFALWGFLVVFKPLELRVFPVNRSVRLRCLAVLLSLALTRHCLCCAPSGCRSPPALALKSMHTTPKKPPRTVPTGTTRQLGAAACANTGAADRLDFTAIGPAVNLVSRLGGLSRPLGRSVLIWGAAAAETATPLVPLGE